MDGFLATKTEPGQVTAYSYSSRGELLEVQLPDGRIISYDHDPLGRRIAKRIDGAIVEKYLWQGRTRLLAVYDGSDSLIQRFEYADGRMPVSMTTGGVIYALACDQVGSLRIVADGAGNVVKRIDYDTFGNIITDTNSSLTLPFGFAGGLHDRDTGLVRFGYRDYDPDTSRWTAKDPIGFAGGDTDLYGYVHNNPVNMIDPEGLHGVLFSRPPIFRPPPSWRPPINARPTGPKPRVTPNPRPRPVIEPPPEVIKPQPKPWYWWVLRLLLRNDLSDDISPGCGTPINDKPIRVINDPYGDMA